MLQASRGPVRSFNGCSKRDRSWSLQPTRTFASGSTGPFSAPRTVARDGARPTP
jgi:hypothetical protein